MRKQYKYSFARWLCKVRYVLRSVGYLNKSTKLCPKSWKILYDENMTPFEAINADLGGSYPFPFYLYAIHNY